MHTFALTEIGPSSQLLIFDEQLPRVKQEREPAYKSQQSTSAEQIRRKVSKIPRYSRSDEASSRYVCNYIDNRNNFNRTNNTNTELISDETEEFYDALNFFNDLI